MYKILSLSGGGIRGYITVSVLAELERRLGQPLHTCFDLIVGTSVGALIGAGLDSMPAAHIKSLFEGEYLKELFKPNLFSFDGLLRPKYNHESKFDAIKSILRSEPVNINYAFTSFDIKTQKPVIFNNLEDADDRYIFTTKYSMKAAVMASSAVPVLWNPYKLDEFLLVDGALIRRAYIQ